MDILNALVKGTKSVEQILYVNNQCLKLSQNAL